MDHIEELVAPGTLRDPMVVAGFMMRRRAGRLGARTVSYLVDSWEAEPIARVDLTPFLNTTVYRPEIRRTETEINITWPEALIYLSRTAVPGRDVVLLPCFEPDYLWKTFANTIGDYLDGIGVRTLVTLRANRGEVPHTRPAPVYVTASDIDLELMFGVQVSRTRNEGPSSIAGVLAAKLEAMRWKTADLAVVQPDYFPRMPNAEAMLALVSLIDRSLGTSTPTATLRETTKEQREILDRLVADDNRMLSAIEEREQTYDRGLENLDFLAPSEKTSDLPSGDEVLREVERLFRGPDIDD